MLHSPRRRFWLHAGAVAIAWSALPLALRGWAAEGGADTAASEEPGEDHRAWQHGVNLLRVDGRVLLIWGSAGNPPKPNLGGAWPHDIYYAWLDVAAVEAGRGAGAVDIPVSPQVLVARPEAQEPPSAAINSGGMILVTAEDGEDDINQRAGLWNAQLKPVRPYPYTIRKGGHSGHAAALGERFCVVYSEGWEDGGGFMNRGSGRDIHARILDARGVPGPEIHLARGQRDGWPQIAASNRNWLAVWQRFAGPSLYSAIIGENGRASAPRRIAGELPWRYAYDVAYAPAIDRYVVAGNSRGAGFIALLDTNGELSRMQGGLPPLVSEARVLVKVVPGATQGEVMAVYATNPTGLAVVGLSESGVRLIRRIEHPHAWDYTGTTGLFLEGDRLLLATLSTRGVRAFTVALGS